MTNTLVSMYFHRIRHKIKTNLIRFQTVQFRLIQTFAQF